MNGYRLTRVWQIDKKLFVADTVLKAIELYKLRYEDCEPKKIQAISSDFYGLDFDAIISEE